MIPYEDLKRNSHIFKLVINPTSHEIMEVLKNKEYSISDLRRKFRLGSYRYVWEIVKKLEQYEFVKTTQKGRKLMVSHHPIIQAQIRMQEWVDNSLKQKLRESHKIVVTGSDVYGEGKKKMKSEYFDEVFQWIVGGYIMGSDWIWKDYDITITKKRKKTKPSKNAKRKKSKRV